MPLLGAHEATQPARVDPSALGKTPIRTRPSGLELMKWPRWTRNPASGVSLPGRSRRQSWLRTTLLRPLYFCARGYVQVEISATRRTICWRPVRSEEQHLAVGGDVGLYVAKRALTVGPRFIDSDQASSTVSRVDTNKSSSRLQSGPRKRTARVRQSERLHAGRSAKY